MSDKTYDTLKFIAGLILPFATFVSVFFDTWNIPYGVQIAATLAALDGFLGIVLKVSNSKYKKKQEQLDGNDDYGLTD